MKFRLILLLFYPLTISFGSMRFVPEYVDIYDLNNTAIFYGPTRHYYFLRTNAEESTINLKENIINSIKLACDSIDRFTLNTRCKGKGIKLSYDVMKFGLFHNGYHIDIIIDTITGLMGLSTLARGQFLEYDKQSYRFSRNLLRKILSLYPYGEFIGKQSIGQKITLQSQFDSWRSYYRPDYLCKWFNKFKDLLLDKNVSTQFKNNLVKREFDRVFSGMFKYKVEGLDESGKLIIIINNNNYKKQLICQDEINNWIIIRLNESQFE